MREELYNLLVKEYDNKYLKNIEVGYNSNRPLTFRVNHLKSSKAEVEEFLISSNIKYDTVDWYSDAFIIRDNIKIEDYPIYKDGKIYVQSLSSMLPVLFLELSPNLSLIDMAASPGGKTTQIASVTNDSVLITAVEKNMIRSERLKYNIEKQGVKKVNVMVLDATKLSDEFKFDRILLDAPCSGSGTISLNDESFNVKLVDKCIKTQMLMLKKAVKLLKKGGILIYSTCSILKEENEKNVYEILKDKSLELIPIEKERLSSVPHLPTTIDGCICVCPSKEYEGFFIAKFRKK